MLEFLLCLFLGMFGAHKFYIKDYKKGFIYLFTIGLFGIGWIVDTIKLFINLVTSEERKQARIEAKAKAEEQRQLALAAEKEIVSKLEGEGVAYCPKCKSTTLQYVERRKQLSLTRAAVGTALIGPLAGAVGAVTSKKYKGLVKCLKCGHSWKI
jgi:DNA-directed RNA polymerase subunit M/transcription elongation factor TFIIS